VSEGARILIVEDEEAIAEGLLLNLRRKGYDPELARDGYEALARNGVTVPGSAATPLAPGTHKGPWDLVLLDVRLPGIDGFEVCRRLRDAGNLTPVLMLTARDQPDDVVYGLKLGADDYLVKPFDLAELLARVESLLRRRAWGRGGAAAGPENGAANAANAQEPAGRFTFGDYWVDFSTYEALTRSGVVQLSQKEVAVMRMFAARPQQVVTRRELLAEVWQLPNHPNTRVVDNVIVALRKAFEENAWRPRHLLSVRGVGYRFVP
jgi:DNA-binding response OmpR family regulator